MTDLTVSPRTPVSTYRLQLQPSFTLDDAAGIVDHLATLGVTHLYLSPVLTPAPGSLHGYDVVDHTRVNPEIGGDEAFERLLTTAREVGLGVVVDIVPNHMSVPTPLWHNAALWSLLAEGPEGPHGTWFDVDWDAGDGQVVLPVLGASLEEVLAAGELVVATDGGPDGDQRVLRYYDKEFPLREGTSDLDLSELVDAQHYRLAHWREGTTSLNYRRFFDVTELAAIRVEDPAVFDATHDLVTGWVRDGKVDGIRVDHPDGLADPAGYLDRLAAATDGAWVVVEKILEGEEELPQEWATAGTTGYDALLRVGGLFVDPEGEAPLTALWQDLTGETRSLHEVEVEAKERIVDRVQVPEIERLARLVARVRPDLDGEAVRRILGAFLVQMDRYRIYLDPERPWDTDVPALELVDDLVARTRGTADEADHEVLDNLRDVVSGRVLDGLEGESRSAAAEFVVRFQQTCGPVMAKGIEDTAFYRYHRFDMLNEVGGDPDRVGVSPDEFHAYAARRHAQWPTTMTLLSTHDTKRAEDVRARLAVLAEGPEDWAAWVRGAWEAATPHRGERLDAITEYFLWQTLVGAWPISEERLQAYALKAIREDKRFTVWTDPDEEYEADVQRFISGVLADEVLVGQVETWLADTATSTRATTLGQKLLQLVMPGVPDVYQGTEVVDLSLVDPDNRRLVDHDARRDRLSRLDGGGAPEDLDDEKLLVTSRALRLRRDHPEWFTGASSRVGAAGSTTPYVVTVARGDDRVQVVAVATRLSSRLDEVTREAALLDLPAGDWTDHLTGRTHTAGEDGLAVRDVLAALPVALLVRADG